MARVAPSQAKPRGAKLKGSDPRRFEETRKPKTKAKGRQANVNVKGNR